MINEIKQKYYLLLESLDENQKFNDKEKLNAIRSLIAFPHMFRKIGINTSINILMYLGYSREEALDVYSKIVLELMDNNIIKSVDWDIDITNKLK